MSSLGKILFYDKNGLLIKAFYYYSPIGRRKQIKDFVRDNRVSFFDICPNVYIRAYKHTAMGASQADKPERPPATYTNIPTYDYSASKNGHGK